MAESTGGRDQESGGDLEKRLQTLKNEIASGRIAGSAEASRQETSPIAQGMRGASEFAAAVILGGAIGLGVDRLAGTRPLFAILFFFVGVAAGVLNVVRAAVPKRPK